MADNYPAGVDNALDDDIHVAPDGRCRYCLAVLDSKAEYEDGQCRPCRDDSIIHRYSPEDPKP